MICMREDIINSYNELEEQARLDSTKARRVEYLTTLKTIDKYLREGGAIADIGCGCGIYSIHYAQKQHEVIAVDIVPKHIQALRQSAKECGLSIAAYECDAVKLDKIADNSIDLVLCLGPLYHLVDKDEQQKCIAECRRIVKPNGYILFAYISCYAVFPYVVRGHREFLRDSLCKKIITEHYVTANDSDCFWTDNYFHAPDEITAFIENMGLTIIEHLAADGQSIAFQQMINQFSDDEFEAWLNYHYMICHENSVIGSSNHGIIVAQKDS